MKRIFCLLICLVMVLSLLPAAAGAATEVDEVSISGLEHPVAGQTLDGTYKIPNRGIYYEKDDDYDEVVWYDLGKNNTLGAPINGSAKAEEEHGYMAELHLIPTGKNSFRERSGKPSVDVELEENMELRVTDMDTSFYECDDSEDGLLIRLYFQTDHLYDRKNPVKLVLDDTFDGTVKAGDYPWSASDFSGFPRSHFDLTVTWYEGNKDLERNKMEDGAKFEAGQTYTLKVELDSARVTRHASFDPDVDIMINGEKGDTWVGNDIGFHAYSLFLLTSSEGIDKVAIKGIEAPTVGGSRQRGGFTCSDKHVEVEYDRWEVVTDDGDTKEFRGEFESGKEYLLYLDLIPDEGYSLSNLKRSSISVNRGSVYEVYYDDYAECWVVVVSFEMDEQLLTGIEVTTPPKKTEYYIGDTFQTKGMVVTATYSDGHTEKLTAEDYEILPDGELEKEDTVITIRYKEGKITKETELNITVIDDELVLTGINVITKPKKTTYKEGEYFDPKGMVVIAVYDDRSTAEVTNLEFYPDDALKEYDDTIFISYTEGRKTVTTELSIKVTKAERILTGLELTKAPVKTEYREGEYFDATGMILTAIYEDNTTAVVDDFTIKPNRALKVTDKYVMIFYTEEYEGRYLQQSVEVEITVVENDRVLKAIEITAPANKLVYTEGEDFDPAGLVITAIYDDKTTEIVKSYTLEPSGKLAVGTKEVKISYTEGAVTKSVTMAVTVKPIHVNPFTDVKESDYFYDAVLWAYFNEPQVTKGISDTEFAPTMTCTRGQVVTFLWRAAGRPEPTTKINKFTDVKEDDYFYSAVLWAVEKNITKGTSDTEFSPKQTCTLAHVITFLYRAADEPGKSEAPEKWYTDAMNWAFGNGMFKDLSFSEIDPGADCARKDIVNFLYIQLG